MRLSSLSHFLLARVLPIICLLTLQHGRLVAAPVNSNDGNQTCFECASTAVSTRTFTTTISKSKSRGSMIPTGSADACSVTVVLRLVTCSHGYGSTAVVYSLDVNSICYSCPEMSFKDVLKKLIIRVSENDDPSGILMITASPLTFFQWRWNSCLAVVQCPGGMQCIRECSCPDESSTSEQGGSYFTQCDKCCGFDILLKRQDCGFIVRHLVPLENNVSTIAVGGPGGQDRCALALATTSLQCAVEQQGVLVMPCQSSCIGMTLDDFPNENEVVQP